MLDGEQPPQLWAVVHEAALRTMVGGPAVMRGQLGRLVELAAKPTVSLQVMPFSAGAYAAMGTAFTIMRLPDVAQPEVVYLEDLWSADYVSRPSMVQAYLSVFDVLCGRALSTRDTTAMIERAMGELP